MGATFDIHRYTAILLCFGHDTWAFTLLAVLFLSKIFDGPVSCLLQILDA